MNTTTSKLTKKEINALGNVFAAEIDNRLPFQSRAQIYKQLLLADLLCPMEKRFGSGFSVLVVGYQLTHAGRIAYCSSQSAGK